MFRLTWLEQHDATQVSSVRGAMKSAVETTLREARGDATSIGSASEPEGEKEGDFSGNDALPKP